jgi:hypothetical protein
VDNTFFFAFYGIIPVVWLWVKLSGKGQQKLMGTANNE